MTEAAYWLAFCGERSLVDDPWCRRLLSEVAKQTMTTGYRGRAWSFCDSSMLIANEHLVMVK